MIELENGRLVRLMVKLGMITERHDQDTDPLLYPLLTPS
jgi:hypothetical protein